MTTLQQNISNKLGSLENNKNIQTKILQLLQASRMQISEKKMWFATLPYMDIDSLTKLHTILEKEVNEVANLSISLLYKQIK